MTNTVRTLATAALLAAVLHTPAAAQMDRSTIKGFNLGVFLSGSAAQVEDADEPDGGRGVSLHLGWGVNESLSLFGRLSGAAIQAEGFAEDSYALGHFDLGARYSFGSSASALRPFLQAAYSGRAASFDLGSQGTLDVRGTGITGGGGLEYFVSPALAIEGGLSFTAGEFSEGRLDGSDWVELDDDSFDMTTTRVDLGISWHP